MRIAVLLLLAGTALAGPTKAPRAIASAEKAVEIARTRGKLIFLTVIIDNDGENRAVIDQVFRNAQFLRIAKEFVILYANSEDQHGKVRVKGNDGKKHIRCRDCPFITCADHINLAFNYARGFYPGDNTRTPIHFVIDADEEVVDTIMNGNFEQGFNHVPAKTVVARLKRILDKHGKGLTEKQYEEMVAALRDAKAARARGKVTLELEKLRTVVAVEKDVEGVREAKTRVKEIDALAAAELKKLDDLIGMGKWEEAIDALEAIETTYPGTLSAVAAATRRRELHGRREVKRIVKSREIYEKGMVLLKRKKLDAARRQFEKCVRLYGGEKYGDLAKKELEKLPVGDG